MARSLAANGSNGSSPSVETSNAQSSPVRVVVSAPDWEEPRLAVAGFVHDYFCYRLQKEGFEWEEAPPLPEGFQNEHRMMRIACDVFEKRKNMELNEFVCRFANSSLTYSSFTEMIDQFGKVCQLTDGMSYSRMLGLMCLSARLAVELSRTGQRRDIPRLAQYASTSLEKAIRLSWHEDDRSWSRFVEFAEKLESRAAGRSGPSSGFFSPSYFTTPVLIATVGLASIFLIGRFIAKRLR